MRLFDLACTLPWAVTESTLRFMLELAAMDGLERKARDLEAISVQAGRRLDNTRTVKTREGVAIIPVHGPIFRRADLFMEISGATTVETITKDFNVALEDPSISAIVLEFDSPGGEVTGINELANLIYAARGRKPIKAYGDGLVASAAIWLATACDEVIVDATSGVGSIGVVMALRDPSKQNAKEIEFVSSQSPKKRPDPTTESGRGQIQGVVDSIADVFVAAVARNRGVTTETVLADFGQGDIFIGEAAVRAGLVDRVASFEDVLAELTRPREAGSQGKDRTMDWKAFFRAAHEVEQEGGQQSPPLAGSLPPMQAQQDPAVQAQLTELQQLRARLAQEQTARIQQDAISFVQAQLVAGHVYPAEQVALAQLYTQLAQDDAVHPLQQADGQPSSRVGLLQGAIEQRPAHQLGSQLVPGQLPKGSHVLPSAQASEEAQLLQQAEESARAYAQSVNRKN